jgi:uncharacterized membrane protein YhaH (DUF805 family)
VKLQIVDAFVNNYANFKGRASRKECWLFFLELMVISFLSSFVKVTVLKIIFGLFFLFLMIPWLAIFIRRLHDIGKSGWYYFISWIPLVGPIIMLIWMCKKGEKGINRYGPNPLTEESVAV